jgi:small subunit ribosomal protein S10
LAKKVKVASKTRIRVKLKAFDSKVIDKATEKIMDVAIRTGAKVAGPVPLPVHIAKQTINRAASIDKRSMEAFEIRTHKRLIDILDPTPSTVDQLSNLSLPYGVGIEIKM